MYSIKFNFEQEGLTPVVVSNIEHGQTLLEIALNHAIELHHNCGGVCSCTTCHLYVESGMHHIHEMTSREEHFLRRAHKPASNSRLGCQALLTGGKGMLELRLPDQSGLEF